HLLFKCLAESVRVGPARKHRAPATTFKSVATNKIRVLLLQVSETRQIKSARAAVVQRRGLAHQILGAAGNARTHYVLAEIVSYVTAGVRQAVGVLPRLREQQQTR